MYSLFHWSCHCFSGVWMWLLCDWLFLEVIIFLTLIFCYFAWFGSIRLHRIQFNLTPFDTIHRQIDNTVFFNWFTTIYLHTKKLTMVSNFGHRPCVALNTRRPWLRHHCRCALTAGGRPSQPLPNQIPPLRFPRTNAKRKLLRFRAAPVLDGQIRRGSEDVLLPQEVTSFLLPDRIERLQGHYNGPNGLGDKRQFRSYILFRTCSWNNRTTIAKMQFLVSNYLVISD